MGDNALALICPVTLINTGAVVGNAGYRYAKIPEMKTANGVFIKSNGDPVGVDFSGPYLRLGVKLVAKGIE